MNTILAIIFICQVSCSTVILSNELETIDTCQKGIDELVLDFRRRSGNPSISGACDIGDPLTYHVGARLGS